MAKIHKLTKGEQTIYPATTTDAVVHPTTRKNLTEELTELNERILDETKRAQAAEEVNATAIEALANELEALGACGFARVNGSADPGCTGYIWEHIKTSLVGVTSASWSV